MILIYFLVHSAKNVIQITTQKEMNQITQTYSQLMNFMMIVDPKFLDHQKIQQKFKAAQIAQQHLSNYAWFSYIVCSQDPFLKDYCQNMIKNNIDISYLMSTPGWVFVQNQHLKHFRAGQRKNLDSKEVDIQQFHQLVQQHMPDFTYQLKTIDQLNFILLSDMYSNKLIYFTNQDDYPYHLKRIASRLFQRIDIYRVNRKSLELAAYLNISSFPAGIVIEYDFKRLDGYKKIILKKQNIQKQELLLRTLQPHIKEKRRDRLFQLTDQAQDQYFVVKEYPQLQKITQLTTKYIIIQFTPQIPQILPLIREKYPNDYSLVHATYKKQSNLEFLSYNTQTFISINRQTWQQQIHNVGIANIDLKTALYRTSILKKGLMIVPKMKSNICSFCRDKNVKNYIDCIVISPDYQKQFIQQFNTTLQNNQIVKLPLFIAFNQTTKGLYITPVESHLEVTYTFISNSLNSIKDHQIIQNNLVKSPTQLTRLVQHCVDTPCIFFFLNKKKKNQYGKHKKRIVDLMTKNYRQVLVFILDINCNQKLLQALELDAQFSTPYLFLNRFHGVVKGNNYRSATFQKEFYKARSEFLQYKHLEYQLPLVNEQCTNQDIKSEMFKNRQFDVEKVHIDRINQQAKNNYALFKQHVVNLKNK